MTSILPLKSYRKDIDGLRAIAVLPVLAFHFGYMPNGFLGVDIFFVISGYLITGILYNSLSRDDFSILSFYLRRTRRILPLALFITAVSLLVGVFTMLPDDLENLAKSVIATNFFSNNILQAITTKNYWDVVNEYKPLMHTWSLGVEEQYYLFYPLLFTLLGKKRQNLLLPLLLFFTTTSLILFLLPFEEHQKFYLLPFRFFELSLGGAAAICLNSVSDNRLANGNSNQYFANQHFPSHPRGIFAGDAGNNANISLPYLSLTDYIAIYKKHKKN